MEDDANKDDITLYGENLFCLFYSDRAHNQSLNKLRFVTFCKKSSTSYNAISPDYLPPTSNAAMYHSLWVYQQVQTWLLNDLPSLKWGYMYQNKRLMPVLMDIPPAPPELLKIFRCSSEGGCKSSRCTCVKHGLKCTLICSQCHGLSCKNIQIQESDFLLEE